MSSAVLGKKPSRAKLFFAAVAALGVQLFTLWMVCSLSSRALEENERQLVAINGHSATLRAETQKLTQELLAADIATHDFLLIGKESAMQPYRRANLNVPAILGRMERLAEGHREELERIHKIGPLNDAAFDKLAELRQYTPPTGGPAHPPESALLAARASMQAVFAEITALQDADTRTLAQSMASVSQGAKNGQKTINDLAGSVGIGGGVIASFLLMSFVLRRERILSRMVAPIPAPANSVPAAPVAPPAAAESTSSVPEIARAAGTALRDAAEAAVGQVYDRAAKRMISFRATIGPAWDIPAAAEASVVQQLIATILTVIVDSDHASGPVTISCLQPEGAFVRLQFHSSSSLSVDRLPPSMAATLRTLGGRIVAGTERGTLWLDLPATKPLAEDITALGSAVKAPGGTMRVANPA